MSNPCLDRQSGICHRIATREAPTISPHKVVNALESDLIENEYVGAREPGGGRRAIAPQLFVSMGWICLCPPSPKFWQSLGISTFLPPPPPRKNRYRAPVSMSLKGRFPSRTSCLSR